MRVIPLMLTALALSGCAKMVTGPDLARRPTPFADRGTIRLDSPDTPVAVITATPDGDTAEVVVDDPKHPFRARMTYRPFTPIIAETNANRHDYWLVGFNLTQTPDRAFYAILRYPHGRRDSGEFRILICPSDKSLTEKPAPPDSPPPKPETLPGGLKKADVLCYAGTPESVETFADATLQDEARAAHGKPASDAASDWTPVTIIAP
jgi:hypothetical protein